TRRGISASPSLSALVSRTGSRACQRGWGNAEGAGKGGGERGGRGVAKPGRDLGDRVALPLAPGGLVPLENRIRLLACGSVAASGGSAVLVDQPVQYGFSVDSLGIEVHGGDAGTFAVPAGNLLADALMRPGHVVVPLVLDQDSAQMRLTEDQHAVEEFAAQGAEEAFAGRVHPGSLDGGPQDPGAGGLEDGVEGLGEV